jgi:UDP-N-acetylmuramoyl-tripeptide--D-alanyl-D-alanine ligase
MRWECQTLNGILVINDAYNANPASMAAALRTFAEMPVRGRRWLVLAGMLELGTQETSAHQELGRQLAPGAWGGLIVVGELGAVIAAAAERAGLDAARIFRCRDQAQAAQRLCRDALPGDAVLLKASRGQRLEQVLAWWKQALPGKE